VLTKREQLQRPNCRVDNAQRVKRQQEPPKKFVCLFVCQFYNIKKKKKFQKIPKLKIYYAKWTLRIEVVNGKKNICYYIFGVYLVTGTKNPDISKEITFRISKLFFYITTRGTLKDGQTRFLRLLLKC
jgi:hypothetical protein